MDNSYYDYQIETTRGKEMWRSFSAGVTVSQGEVSTSYVGGIKYTIHPLEPLGFSEFSCSLHGNDKLQQFLVSNSVLLGVIGDLLQAQRLEASSIFMIWLFDPKKPEVVILTVVKITSDVSKGFLTITSEAKYDALIK